MPRSQLPLALVLACLAGSGDAGDAEPPTPSPATPLRQDVRLVAARNARPWQPPAEGNAPVVEVLRDGSWVFGNGTVAVDAMGERAPGGRDRFLQWAADQARQMPWKPLDPRHEKSPLIPANPLLLRVDRDATWGSVRPIFRACTLQGIFLVDIDLAVANAEAGTTPVVRLPLVRIVGMVNYAGGEPTTHVAWLAQGSDPAASASRLGFSAQSRLGDLEYPRLEEVEYHDLSGFVRALKEPFPWGNPSILFSDEAPWWAAFEVLELALEAGLYDFEVPSKPVDEHMQDLRAEIAAAQAGNR